MMGNSLDEALAKLTMSHLARGETTLPTATPSKPVTLAPAPLDWCNSDLT